MAKFRPMSWWDRFCAGELPFEMAIAVGTLVAGGMTGARFLTSSPAWPTLAGVSFGGGGVAFVALIWRAIVRNRKAQNTRELSALDGVLHALHAIMTAGTSGVSLRICIFVPGKTDDTCHQITDYVGVEKPSGCGRDLPRRCGAVGTAFRTGKAQYVKLPTDTNVSDFLINSHGFERSEISEAQQDRKSWAAIPVGDPGSVVAVVYLDCDIREFFGNINSSKRKTLESTTIGVANFISRV
jgi:hypothetical protein